jgi:xanthine dehydrogenase YagR molybdenum-binding subunit
MSVAAPEPKANMGRPEPRYDARLKVTGEARFPSDMPVSNAAFAFLVTSSIAKGRIEQLDLTPANAVPGMLEIFTHENTSELKPGNFNQGASTSIDKLGPDIAHAGNGRFAEAFAVRPASLAVVSGFAWSWASPRFWSVIFTHLAERLRG